MQRPTGMWQRRISNNLLKQPLPPAPPPSQEVQKLEKERKKRKIMEEGSQSRRRRAALCWQLTSCEKGRRRVLCVSTTANLTATAYIFWGHSTTVASGDAGRKCCPILIKLLLLLQQRPLMAHPKSLPGYLLSVVVWRKRAAVAPCCRPSDQPGFKCSPRSTETPQKLRWMSETGLLRCRVQFLAKSHHVHPSGMPSLQVLLCSHLHPLLPSFDSK